MYTANTMASAIEALGMSLANSSAQEAVSNSKMDDCRRAGEAVVNLIREWYSAPGHHDEKKAFENAIVVVNGAGRIDQRGTASHGHGSRSRGRAERWMTLRALAREKTPVLADLKPSGKYLMSELIEIGGIQPLMKRLLDRGLLHGDCLTVTGRTLAENLADVAGLSRKDQDIVRDFDNPAQSRGPPGRHVRQRRA